MLACVSVCVCLFVCVCGRARARECECECECVCVFVRARVCIGMHISRVSFMFSYTFSHTLAETLILIQTHIQETHISKHAHALPLSPLSKTLTLIHTPGEISP